MTSLKCRTCGRFFSMVPGVAWQMRYSGMLLEPEEEIYRCLPCVQKYGEFDPQPGIKPEYSCGVMK